ncbi:MAG: dienelactone hydrolase family protein [Alphaproteobacteria bacterium]
MIELTASDGHKFPAYRADPAEAPKGAVIVLQDMLGIDAHTTEATDKFAAQGYVAIAPSLIERVTANAGDKASAADASDLMNAGAESALLDIQAVIDAVKDAGKVAIVGYSAGGTLAYLASNRLKGLACTIAYYGRGIVDDYGEKRRIPTLIHFSESDGQVPMEKIIQFRARRPDVSAFTYPAGPGFDCSDGESLDEESSARALERTLFWISQYVVGQPPILLKNSGAYAAAKTEKKKKPAKAAADDGPP